MALGSVSLIAEQAAGGGGGGREGRTGAAAVARTGLGSPQAGYGGPNYDWDAYARGQQRRWQGTPSGIMGNLYGQYAPDFANNRTQGQLLQNQYDMLLGRYGADRGDLQSQFGLNMRGIGLDRQGLGIGRQSARRGIRNTKQEERIARALLANAQQQANSDAGNAVVDAQSEATASGAFTAPGIRHNMGEIYGNLVMERDRNQLGFRRDLLGIREQRAQHRDALKNLDLEASRLGLRSDELQQALRTGLRNLRLDTAMSASDLLSALSSNRADLAALSRQIYQSALQTMGLGMGV